jgi:membrane-bound ClpP family serine protease
MSWTIIIVFLLAGLILLLLEILVLPGATVFGIMGFLLLGFSVWQAYAAHGTPEGHFFLLGAILLTVLLLAVALKSRTWNRAMLSTAIDSKVDQNESLKVKVGDEGTTVSRLAPSGKAIIGNEFYEVQSSGEYVDPQTPVIVTKIDFNKIIVKPKIT